MIPKMFRMIWLNYNEILSPATKPQPKLRSPMVDFTKVNRRIIDNLPKPELYPIHGVSQDPDFYQMTEDRVTKRGIQAKHNGHWPFGSFYGYMTQLGPVPVSVGDLSAQPQVVHGHVFDETLNGWVLFAEYPSDKNQGHVHSHRGLRGSRAEGKQHPHHKKRTNG